jgi:hypothetical protein
MTPDPFSGSASQYSPQSWNRYPYAMGDPVGGKDPTGLCTAMFAGGKMAPGDNEDFDQLSDKLQSVTAYPYSNDSGDGGALGDDLPSTIGAGVFTALGVQTGAAGVGKDALQMAAQTEGSINIVTDSAGAQIFKTALASNPNLKSRIGNIVYIAPSAVGLLPISENGTTTIVLGKGYKDVVAGIAVQFPIGADTIHTNCDHTDFGCLEALHVRCLLLDEFDLCARDPSASPGVPKINVRGDSTFC